MPSSGPRTRLRTSLFSSVDSAMIRSSCGRRRAGGTDRPNFFGLGVRSEVLVFGLVSAIYTSLYCRNLMSRQSEAIQHFVGQTPQLISCSMCLRIKHRRKLLGRGFRDLRVVVKIGIKHMPNQANCCFYSTSGLSRKIALGFIKINDRAE